MVWGKQGHMLSEKNVLEQILFCGIQILINQWDSCEVEVRVVTPICRGNYRVYNFFPLFQHCHHHIYNHGFSVRLYP